MTSADPRETAPRRNGRPALADHVYELLFNRIAGGELAQNTRLPGEHQLAEKYGVSRPVVREALRRLREEGLIESRQGAGSWVTGVVRAQKVPAFTPIASIADIRRCYEFRIAVERETAFLAAQRITEKTLADIAQALALMDIATRQHVHREDADFAFHHAIAVASDNHYLSSSLLGLRQHIDVVMKLHGKSVLGSTPSLEHVFAEHRGIFEAIRAGDAAAAGRLMEEHLAGSRDRLFGVD
ncbi:FCD domain-containing protein [Rhodoplanes sp. TEM]|uniref:FCD domain-containing protein n=1 Tax=Rhodoplanes tepidamans TaxID=200616 RepID=A0ABT5J5Z1_RHOTP|nr:MULTISPECIES: FCD domain-containing protein [Rhodoplanes]MDC7785035.1 FCD domain-containing protein [Rhodoplanes tepidamans]MDC7982509.1 FCD domain-containing protein [Rhodoplanes sp. TEM]MDQ0356523.1 DNA-binding FadR family transcriptional regulator [Rhodoplanes tepidamans]